MTFLETISSLLEVPMREGKIRQYAGLLDREGRMTRRVQLDLILALCDKVVELEKLLQPLPPSLINVSNTRTELAGLTYETDLTKEAQLKLKRQENIKKAQEARRKKYELKRAQTQQNA